VIAEPLRVRYGREFWRQLVSEVEEGGSVGDVARRHRVRPGTLSWWRWKLKRVAPAEPMLLPVVVRPVASGPSAIELQVGDLIVRVPTGTDVAYVAKLVAALRV
jgi:transposase-like protein